MRREPEATLPIDGKLVERLYRRAKGERWRASTPRFADALEAAAARQFAGRTPGARELETYCATLHLEDLALACACADGDEEAWEHFVLTQRPLLYRAADAIDPGGGARDIADSLYAELFGLKDDDGERRSLFRYFHGRSSLTTWLRALLGQRHVDRLRAARRIEPFPDEESPAALRAPAEQRDPDRDRQAGLMRSALERAVADLAPRDRLRLACYYAQDLTLAQTGRVLGEHEATSSRQLARTRRDIRSAVERFLREEAGLGEAAIAQCFASVAGDAGSMDVAALLDSGPARKESPPDRSSRGTVS